MSDRAAPGPRLLRDDRATRLFELADTEAIVVKCECGKVTEYGSGILQRLNRIPSDTLVYDLQYRPHCARCNRTADFVISILDVSDRGDSSKPRAEWVIVPGLSSLSSSRRRASTYVLTEGVSAQLWYPPRRGDVGGISMSIENKIAAAILTASIAQRATHEAPLEEAPATIARLYTEFLTIVERSAAGQRRTHEEWRTWVQQIMGVLPH